MSEDTANLIDEEVKALVDEGYKRAENILKKHKDQLEILAKALLEHETLTGNDIDDVLKGKKIKKPDTKVKKAIKKSSVPITVTDKAKEDNKEKSSKPKKKPVKAKKGPATEGA